MNFDNSPQDGAQTGYISGQGQVGLNQQNPKLIIRIHTDPNINLLQNPRQDQSDFLKNQNFTQQTGNMLANPQQLSQFMPSTPSQKPYEKIISNQHRNTLFNAPRSPMTPNLMTRERGDRVINTAFFQNGQKPASEEDTALHFNQEEKEQEKIKMQIIRAQQQLQSFPTELVSQVDVDSISRNMYESDSDSYGSYDDEDYGDYDDEEYADEDEEQFLTDDGFTSRQLSNKSIRNNRNGVKIARSFNNNLNELNGSIMSNQSNGSPERNLINQNSQGQLGRAKMGKLNSQETIQGRKRQSSQSSNLNGQVLENQGTLISNEHQNSIVQYRQPENKRANFQQKPKPGTIDYNHGQLDDGQKAFIEEIAQMYFLNQGGRRKQSNKLNGSVGKISGAGSNQNHKRRTVVRKRESNQKHGLNNNGMLLPNPPQIKQNRNDRRSVLIRSNKLQNNIIQHSITMKQQKITSAAYNEQYLKSTSSDRSQKFIPPPSIELQEDEFGIIDNQKTMQHQVNQQNEIIEKPLQEEQRISSHLSSPNDQRTLEKEQTLKPVEVQIPQRNSFRLPCIEVSKLSSLQVDQTAKQEPAVKKEPSIVIRNLNSPKTTLSLSEIPSSVKPKIEEIPPQPDVQEQQSSQKDVKKEQKVGQELIKKNTEEEQVNHLDSKKSLKKPESLNQRRNNGKQYLNIQVNKVDSLDKKSSSEVASSQDQNTNKTPTLTKDVLDRLKAAEPKRRPPPFASQTPLVKKSSRKSIFTNSVSASRKNGKKKINQYIRQNYIGEGKYAKVYKCINDNDKKEYAMKILKKDKLNGNFKFQGKKAYNFLESEIAILKKLDHPNVLTLYEIIDDPNIKKIYIITDFIKNGNLAERMSSKDALTLEQVRKYFRDLMSAVDYCHNVANVLHRDIKPENILIGDDDSVKLADFGVSQMIENGDDTLHSKIGTQFFMSPEMFQAASYRGKPADIWACGIVLYQMANKKALPFNSSQLADLQRVITHEEPNYNEIKDPQLMNLLQGILRKDPQQRFTIEDILDHPWMTNNGQEPMRRLNTNQIVITPADLKSVVTKVVQLNRLTRMMKHMKRDAESNNGGNTMNSPASLGTPQVTSILGSQLSQIDPNELLVSKGTAQFGAQNSLTLGQQLHFHQDSLGLSSSQKIALNQQAATTSNIGQGGKPSVQRVSGHVLSKFRDMAKDRQTGSGVMINNNQGSVSQQKTGFSYSKELKEHNQIMSSVAQLNNQQNQNQHSVITEEGHETISKK